MVQWCLTLLLGLTIVLVGCDGVTTPQAGDPCSSIGDCAAGGPLSCLDDVCRELTCERSETCPLGAACVDGSCQAPQCLGTADCPASENCFEGDCRADVCQGKSDCAVDQVCLGVPGLCVEAPSSCRRDEECIGFLACRLPEGICQPRCVDDGSCPVSTYCDGEFCRAVCFSSGDCPAGQACAEGRCVGESDCSERAPCDPVTPQRHPLTCACSECLVDLDCGADPLQGCTSSGRCRYCLRRTQEPEVCANQGLFFEDGCCVACVDDADCPVGTGQVCARGQCHPAPLQECTLDTDCVEPEVCDAGRCQRPGSGAPCVGQADCPAGEACYADARCGAVSERCVDCPAPSRCVAEPGDTRGTCAGCTVACQTSACPNGQLCVVGDSEVDGYCADVAFAASCR